MSKTFNTTSEVSVNLYDVMGNDLTPVVCARVSHDNDERSQPVSWEYVDLGPLSREQPILTDGQKRLIQHLVRGMTRSELSSLIGEVYEAVRCDRPDKVEEILWKFRRTPTHAAPFGHCSLSFRVEAPIFVVRQLVKHEYLRMSEVSRRYVDSEVVYYKPEQWHKIAEDVKQGAGGVSPLQEDANEDWSIAVEASNDTYKYLLEYIAPEEARMVLPLCHMTKFYWSGSLDAFANMCNLRLDSHAQSVTREVAQKISNLAAMAFPVSWAALVTDHRSTKGDPRQLELF